MSDAKDEKRRNEILSGVIRFVSPNTANGTKDCYMQRPDGSTQWIEYNDDFMDTLSVFLDATIDGNTVYVRQYKNGKGEIIKLERPIIINPEQVSSYINSDITSERKIFPEPIVQKNSRLIYKYICNLFPTVSGNNTFVYFRPISEVMPIASAYQVLKNHLNGKEKNQNEFSIEEYIDGNGQKITLEKPAIIANYFLDDYIKSIKQ